MARTVSKARAEPMRVHLISDSTGNLLRHALGAVLTQFPEASISTEVHSFIDGDGDLRAVVQRLSQEHADAVVHGVVSGRLKTAIEKACRALKIPSHDLTRPLVEFLSGVSGVEPAQKAKRLHNTNDEYYRRIEALEFTLNHDDALGLQTLDQADLVLVGISRTGKTPTSIFLAQQGYRVANVALAKEVPPPPQLIALDKQKIVGLLISPQRLREVRASRLRDWGSAAGDYDDMDSVRREVIWSRKLFQELGWASLDVTDQAVEETAARVLKLLRRTG